VDNYPGLLVERLLSTDVVSAISIGGLFIAGP